MARLGILLLYVCISATIFSTTEARAYSRRLRFREYKVSGSSKPARKMKMRSELGFDPLYDFLTAEPYPVSSPFTIPPYDSLSPLPLPANAPPYCINPPSATQPPYAVPSPVSYSPAPPPPGPNFPSRNTPPATPTYPLSPNPPTTVPNTPNSGIFGPPKHVPSPPKHTPSPTVYLPPVVFPPPAAPSPPHRRPQYAVWCVAKPTVPDPIIQEAMDYACGSGADCKSIEQNGSCFQPNTLLAHASYAFNSYWQNAKAAGGTCDFGGTAMLVTMDPSYNECTFIFN